MGSSKLTSGQPTTQERSPAATPASPAAAALPHRLGNHYLQQLLQSRVLLAKLTVSDPGDAFEQEADRVADQVMRMPAHHDISTTTAPVAVRRKCAMCEDELQRSEVANDHSAPTVDVATEHAINSLSGGGHALPESVRSFMEPRFAADLSTVRIHTDAQAHDLARSVNARAFTVGRDVVFGAGYYAPQTDSGLRLLAHELTHTLQQGATTRLARDAKPRTSPDEAEERAKAVAMVEAYLARSEEEERQAAKEEAEEEAARKKKIESKYQPSLDMIRPDRDVDPSLMAGIYAPVKEYEEREQAARARRRRAEEALDETRPERFRMFEEVLEAHRYTGDVLANFMSGHFPMRDLLVLRKYGLEWPHWYNRHKFQDKVKAALARYAADQHKQQFGRAPVLKEFTEKDEEALRKQQMRAEFERAWVEGLGHVTGSVAGGFGAWFTSQFTDDPRKITAGAKLGTATAGVVGSFGQAAGHRGAYKPEAEQPYSATGAWRYKGPAPTKPAAVKKPAVQEPKPIPKPAPATPPPLTVISRYGTRGKFVAAVTKKLGTDHRRPPGWQRVIEALKANPGPNNRKILGMIEKVMDALQNPKHYGEVLGDAWDLVKAGQAVDINDALLKLASKTGVADVPVVTVTKVMRADEFFNQVATKRSHWVDQALGKEAHGEMTHLLQDLVVNKALGSPRASAEFRELLGKAEGTVQRYVWQGDKLVPSQFAQLPDGKPLPNTVFVDSKNQAGQPEVEWNMQTGDYVWRFTYDLFYQGNALKTHGRLPQPERLRPALNELEDVGVK